MAYLNQARQAHMPRRAASSASDSSSSSSSSASSSSSYPTSHSNVQPSFHPEWLPKQDARPQFNNKPILAGLKLDCLRASQSTSRIVAADTKECLYSITKDANVCSPISTGLHRGSVLDSQSHRVASSPFATLKGKSIYMPNSDKRTGQSALKVKKRDFLYSSGFFGQ